MTKVKVVIANEDGEVLELFWCHQKVTTPNTKSMRELSNRLARQIRQSIELRFNATDEKNPSLE